MPHQDSWKARLGPYPRVKKTIDTKQGRQHLVEIFRDVIVPIPVAEEAMAHMRSIGRLIGRDRERVEIAFLTLKEGPLEADECARIQKYLKEHELEQPFPTSARQAAAIRLNARGELLPSWCR